jgi:hypothetical protein
LATKGELELDHISNYSPFYESDKTWNDKGEIVETVRLRQEQIGWKVFNTHLLWSMLPRFGGNARFIYLMRNGKDVCTSFYHHLTHQSIEDGGVGDMQFDEFVRRWTNGETPFGLWTHHLESWRLDASRDPRVLVLTYEDMKNDLSNVLLKINDHCKFDLSPSQITQLLPRFSVDYMKANIDKFNPISVRWVDKRDDFQFIRKGTIGDNKHLFTDETIKLFNDMIERDKHILSSGLPYYLFK